MVHTHNETRNLYGVLGVGRPVEMRVWEIKYQRYYGEDMTLNFGSFYLFENYIRSAILRQATEIVNQAILDEFVTHFFPEHEWSSTSLGARVGIQPTFVDYYLQIPRSGAEVTISYHRAGILFSEILNPQSGIRLRYVTAQDLVADWNFVYWVHVTINNDELHDDIIDRALEMTRYLAAYLGQERIEVFVGHTLKVVYYKSTDTFELPDN